MQPISSSLLFVIGVLAQPLLAQSVPATTAAFPVTINVDAAKPIGAWKPIYRFFGADEPNYATMKDGQKLINELGQLRPGEVYFRAHNLLTSGDGTPAYKWGSTNAYTEDAQGHPVYNWTILDKIFDTYHAAGIKPYVEIGFMPEALSIHPEPYQHHWKPGDPASDIVAGWAYPPKDYNKWGELVYQWAKHCVERYGMTEVEQWYWEVWNEANTGAQSGIGYLCAPASEYQKLYDYSIAAVRRAIPNAKVGGAEAAGDGGQWSRDFIEHCLTGTNYATGQIGTPVDFFSFHAKGSTPTIVDGHVRMGLGGQLRTISNGFTIAASYPQIKPLPIIISESDPDGCAACIGPNLAYRPGSLFASYTAACIPREFELADRLGVNLEGALTWSFEFENEPYFKGQRVLATNGVDLPILNLFRMYSKMDGQRVAVSSTNAISLDDIMRSGVRGSPDVSALATLGKDKLCVMLWHYHDDDVPGPDARVTLNLTGLPTNLTQTKLVQYRIDDNHSNAFTVWKKMGSPEKPTVEQYNQLEKAGQLEQMDGPTTASVTDGKATLQVSLPRQSVAFFVLDWADAAAPTIANATPTTAAAPPIIYASADLPGKGLMQHPFMYAGEWNYPKKVQSIFIVREGKIAWHYDIPTNIANADGPRTLQEFSDATMLSNGNVVFARKTGAGEVTPDKKLIWNYDAPKGFEVHTIQPIGTDRVMIIQNGDPAKLMIINTISGKTEKEIVLPTGNPKNAHPQFRGVRMTAAGTFLAAHMDNGKVAEYNADGKEIWSVAVPSPWSAVRLKNGNTLITSNKSFAREVDPKGETVWEFTQKDVPNIKLFVIQGAERLANGNTVLMNWCPNAIKNPKDWRGSVQVLEVTPDKKVVWALRSWTDPADLGPASVIQLLDEPGVPEQPGDQQR